MTEPAPDQTLATADEHDWKDFVPNFRRLRPPNQVDVDAFLEAATMNRELRQRVLGELRERVELSSTTILTVAAIALPVLALSARVSGTPLWLTVVLLLGASLIPIITIVVSLFNQTQARHAKSWLAAFEEAEQRAREAKRGFRHRR